MKKVQALLIILLSSFSTYAQAPDYDDLKILFADAKYEKLVAVADKYTLKESTKSDPNPHMWKAKGLYKVSMSGTDDEAFKNAYKDALGSLTKVMKLDKDSTCMRANQEFIDELQMSVVERVNNGIASDKFRDASGWAVKYYKISANIIGPKYIEAAAKFRNGDKGGASAIWKECEKMLPEITNLEGWTKADVALFQIGVLQTSECYLAARQKEKAVALLDKVAPWFEEDEEFKTRYDEIVN